MLGVTSACSSSNHAIATAFDMLRLGRADAIVAGGSEAPLSYGVLKAWESMRILAKTGCRPFSADREGLVLGDGAGALVLETLESATRRGAPILAEIAGAGLSADAGDIVSPSVEGPASAMRACLAEAGLAPGDVDYVNAHGTATSANDKIETQAIRAVFGADADRAFRLLDQVDARPLPRRIGRAGGDRLHRRDPRRRGAADRGLHRTLIRSAIST